MLEKEKQAQFNSFWAFIQEEEYWRLKSQSTWLKAGDQNTSFSHKQCRARLSQNHISEITSLSGVSIKGNDQIKLVAEVHFQNLYKEDGFVDSDLTSDFLTHIPCLVRDEKNEVLM